MITTGGPAQAIVYTCASTESYFYQFKDHQESEGTLTLENIHKGF